MKNSTVYNKLGELSTKYASKGVTLVFEFNRLHMIFRAWTDLFGLNKFNRSYPYELLENLSDDIDIETLVDEFMNQSSKELIKQHNLSNKSEVNNETNIL